MIQYKTGWFTCQRHRATDKASPRQEFRIITGNFPQSARQGMAKALHVPMMGVEQAPGRVPRRVLRTHVAVEERLYVPADVRRITFNAVGLALHLTSRHT